MGRFASTVAYYEGARPPYGAAFFEAVALRLGLDGSERLLDVGAGPGILAIGFAPYCREAIGVDPEPGMVEAARAAAERADAMVSFVEGRFEDAVTKLGAFDIVTIGRAIHWLDPEPARAALERVLAPRGRVLVCGATSAKDGRNPWVGTSNAVRDRWKGDRPSRDHHTFFADGPFTRTGTIRVEGTYAISVERLVERVLSMSTSSSERLGHEVPAMKRAMRDALAPFASNGMIKDIVEARAEVFERA
jgi:SAM-dependent methyltransferase